MENTLADEVVPTNVESKEIKAISKDTVDRICSGQVVLSLAVAVKELVENSIDAKATSVEVKLKDHGLESIEVIDNGTGVEEQNIEGMTAKYHTSKIREFHDLQGVETYGFRGEALSSLCALSNMVIITKHANSEAGIRIELNHKGQIHSKSSCARAVGTTVVLTNIFKTLPVRRKDFAKNVKREFAKMCNILQSYCMIATGVRLVCSNTSSKGVKTVVLSTYGSNNISQNIESIFGSKQFSELLELKSPYNSEDSEERITKDDLNSSVFNNYRINDEDIELMNLAKFQIVGWISNANHDSGRSARDRQFFYVNSRPCDSKNIAKTINETYRAYNMSKFPFILLNVVTDRCDVDVNLTPDKRQLLLNNERILLIIIKKSLEKTFENSTSACKLKNSSINFEPVKKADIEEQDLIPNKDKFMQVFTQWKNTGEAIPSDDYKGGGIKRKSRNEIEIKTTKLRKIDEYLSTVGTDIPHDNTQELDKSESIEGLQNYIDSQKINSGNEFEYFDDNEDNSENISTLDCSNNIQNTEIENIVVLDSDNISILESSNIQNAIEMDSTPKKEYKFTIDCKTEPKTKEERPLKVENILLKKINLMKSSYDEVQNNESSDDSIEEIVSKKNPTDYSSDEDFNIVNKSAIETAVCIDTEDEVNESRITNSVKLEISTTIEEIEKLTIMEQTVKHEFRKSKKDMKRLKFKSALSTNDNKSAEEELEKEISKEMFLKMEIIGQFNLGFIIVKLENYLFIVDQHASDEKYNFETLQREVIMQKQKLAVPQPLDLTAVNEMILVDHLEVFNKNGFHFEIDESAPPTKRIKLVSKPYSKQWEFGREDIDELIFMLQDAPKNTICRPSRIRKMFASRACRKSIMIGSALSKKIMRTLIDHMSEMDLPWNCPHGRPTMRYLINLCLLEPEDENDND